MGALIPLISLLWMVGPPFDPSGVTPQPVLQEAVGIGRPPARGSVAQRRLMARRAGEVVAVRQLARECSTPNGQVFRGFRYGSARTLSHGRLVVKVERWPLHTVHKRRNQPGRHLSQRESRSVVPLNAVAEEQPIP
ncbi:MAG: hypothetical protein AABZ47_03915 [Planctomycetota bacterium]